MTRFFSVMLAVVIAGLVTAPAWAAVPYPPYCTKVWQNVIDDSAIGICPKGDYSRVYVCIKDQFNQPMVGKTVTVNFSCNGAVVWCPSGNIGITGADGCVTIYLKGGVVNPGPIALWCTITVTCEGVIIETDHFFLYSPDYNGDLNVNATDFATFSDDWGVVMKDNHSGFDRANPQVNATDFAVFASHWKHVCI